LLSAETRLPRLSESNGGQGAESKKDQLAPDFQIQCEVQQEKGNMVQLEFQFNSNESAKPTKFSEDYGHNQYIQ
jgi:hypothetical protein